MKRLILIGGPMGVGKTTACETLTALLPKNVFLDGDWCWKMSPFTVNGETKKMVMENISFLLSNFLKCSQYENIIFCWVMHEQSIIDELLARIPTQGVQVHTISLVATPEALSARIGADIASGKRTPDVLERALAYLPKYGALHTERLDVTSLSPAQTAQAICALVSGGQTLCDLHIHSQSSHDSTTPVADSAKACLEKGISVMAVTDHCDMQYYESRDMPLHMRNSVEEATREAKAFEGKLTILRGIEFGEALWDEAHTAEIMASHPYDVVLGSVHAVRYPDMTDPYSVIDFTSVPEETLKAYLKAYFDDVLDMIERIPFDILTHLTCPLRYINGKYRRGVSARDYEAQIEKILRAVIDRGIALEVNTSGLGTSYGDFFPEEWILRTYRLLGGERITLGSDAHIPENVGKGFAEAMALLHSLGFTQYYYYKERKPVACALHFQ